LLEARRHPDIPTYKKYHPKIFFFLIVFFLFEVRAPLGSYSQRTFGFLVLRRFRELASPGFALITDYWFQGLLESSLF